VISRATIVLWTYSDNISSYKADIWASVHLAGACAGAVKDLDAELRRCQQECQRGGRGEICLSDFSL